MMRYAFQADTDFIEVEMRKNRVHTAAVIRCQQKKR